MDILSTNEEFELALEQRQSKAFGICPIRRNIYDQLFGETNRVLDALQAHTFTDELIRQVTVSCAERGLLLLRVRDEIRMTIHCYQSLLESSIAYGLRKAILYENQQKNTVHDMQDERERNAELVARVRLDK
jgi:dynein light intermediate chain